MNACTKPPLFLSGSYDREKRQVVLEWVNPEQEHDKIICDGKELAAGTSRCVFDTQDIGERRIDDLRFQADSSGGEGTNITLPANVSSLTVWVRHSASNSSGVGLDRVRIEDLSLKN